MGVALIEDVVMGSTNLGSIRTKKDASALKGEANARNVGVSAPKGEANARNVGVSAPKGEANAQKDAASAPNEETNALNLDISA